MKLKIGILGCRGIPNAYGGFEQFAEQLSIRLVNKGHEVIVYNSSLHPNKQKEWNRVTIVHCRDWEDKLGAAGQFIYDWNCINDSRKRNFDIVLQLGYTSNSIWYWRWPKNAIHIVNMDGLEWKRTQYSKPVRSFIKKAERWAATYADHMVADSTGIQQHIFNTYQKMAAFIPYAADLFSQPDVSSLKQFQVHPYEYYLTVCRVEPENNIEMIIEGYMNSRKDVDLVIVGGINEYGKRLMKKYNSEKIKFIGSVFDRDLLNNLRYFSKLYFHGHSVGGTNPSLLEAMACHCSIASHDNVFNKAVLGNDAEYFTDSSAIKEIIDSECDTTLASIRKEKNIKRIREVYQWDKISDAYEELMFNAIHAKENAMVASLVRQIA